MPNAVADAEIMAQLKSLGLVEEKGWSHGPDQAGNRLLAQGRQHG